MDNNAELKELMAMVSLTQSDVANFTESSIDTVKSWCCKAVDRQRHMPKGKLKLLKFELQKRGIL